MSESEDLKAQAEELGIEVDGRWSAKRIQKEIDAALAGDDGEENASEPEEEKAAEPAPAAKGDTVKNVSTAVHYVCGHRVAPGASVELSANDKKDEHAMKRVVRGVKMGFLERI